MSFGICNLSIVPLRMEASDASEMKSQILFGEHFKVLESNKEWSKIQLHFDSFEGYINNKQFEEISESLFHKLSNETQFFSGELIDFITDNKNQLTTIPIGCKLPLYSNGFFEINRKKYNYQGAVFNKVLSKKEILQKAFLFLNTPYLWGGRTPFGIDSDGFTQIVYNLCGFNLKRNAQQQATQGEVLSFIEESEPGDLAFFDDEEGIINHVGIILNDYNIIHAFGKVRIDILDHSGIYNVDLKKHTHKLRVIKKII